jgi:formate dehydrogenase
VSIRPAGISARELIDEYCGGTLPGHVHGYLPGAIRGTASVDGRPALDFDTLQPHGCFIGSAAVIVLSWHDRARDAALNLMQFFADDRAASAPAVGTERQCGLPHTEMGSGAARGLSQAMADVDLRTGTSRFSQSAPGG